MELENADGDVIPTSPPLKLFISYSHKDEELKDNLLEHLASLERYNIVQIWHDRDIHAGSEWNQEILKAIGEAKIILLLVTARFIASEVCYEREMHEAMMRHQQKKATVIPVIAAPCSWQDAPFASLEVLPQGGKPILDWPNPDAAYNHVIQQIASLIQIDRLIKERCASKDGGRIERHSKPHSILPKSKRIKVIFSNRFSDCANFTLYLDKLDQEGEQFNYNLVLHFCFSEERMELPTGAVGLRMAGGRLNLQFSKGNFRPTCDYRSEEFREKFIESFISEDLSEDNVELTWIFKKLDNEYCAGYMEGNFEVLLGTLMLTESSSLNATFNKKWKRDLYFDNYEFINGILGGEKLSDNKMLSALRAYSEIFVNPRLKPWLSNADLGRLKEAFRED